MIGLEASVARYKSDRTDKSFEMVLSNCREIFGSWYRNVQRHTKLDRQQLLSEFQLLVLKSLIAYDPLQASNWNGFECYLRSAAKKLGFSLRRRARHRMEHLPDRYDIPDPKSHEEKDLIDTVDVLESCLTKTERAVVILKTMGNTGAVIRNKLNITEFYYRESIKNIRSNQRLQNLLSKV